jgi:hypothetical protein
VLGTLGHPLGFQPLLPPDAAESQAAVQRAVLHGNLGAWLITLQGWERGFIEESPTPSKQNEA